MMAKSAKDFELSKEENKAYFDKSILPSMKLQYDFKPQDKPTAFFTAGLPGAGKSKVLDAWEKQYKDIIVVDVDNLRKEHPNTKEILKHFGEKASEVTHVDAVRWAAQVKIEAIQNKANYILDSSMRKPRSAEIEIDQASSNGYDAKVTMVAVNEYESLQGVFNRYAFQYANNSKDARFVDPSFVKESSLSILESAATIEKMDIKEFKIVNRDMEVLFDSTSPVKNKSAKETLKEHIDIRTWDKDKVAQLKNDWDNVINKLENIKAPEKVIESAKSTKSDLLNHLKQISQVKVNIVDRSHAAREVIATPIELEHGFQAVAVQGDAQLEKWGIYEIKSGLLIDQASTKKEALDKSNDLIKSLGKDAIDKKIANYGKLPTFEKKVKNMAIKQQSEIRTHNEAKRNKVLEQLRNQSDKTKFQGKER